MTDYVADYEFYDLRDTVTQLETRIEDLEAKLAKAVEALDESLYFLQPDERDISKQAGKYRIVKAYEEITGQKYQVDGDKDEE